MERRIFVEIDSRRYAAADGSVLQREYDEMPNGEPMNGRWVYRDPTGALIDYDQYRFDIEARLRIKLSHAALAGSI